MENRLKFKFALFIACFLLVFIAVIAGCYMSDDSTIRIGVITELTGDTSAAALSCKNAAVMAVNEINNEGGVDINGKVYKLKLFIVDSSGKGELAAAAARKLITEDRVLAIIGPNISSNAIPAAEVAESLKTVLIATWSTNVKTTIDAKTGAPKKYVFRAAYIDPWQGRIGAKFVAEKMNAKKAAVLYDKDTEYNKGLAEVFRKTFEQYGGKVVAFESYSKDEKDFTAQLARIKKAAPNVLFLPNYYTEIPLQVKQAHKMGIRLPMMGGDACVSPELIKLCGADCEGMVFTTHYSPVSASQAVRKFNSSYKMLYHTTPDDPAALTYDAFGLLRTALAGMKTVDRESLREAMSKIKKFEGVTGTMQFKEGSGDPVKSVVIVQIKGGRFIWYADAMP